MSKLKKFSIPNLSVTQASATSLLIFIVGKVVAYVPSLAPEKAAAISTGTLVIAVAFAAVHAVHSVVDLVAQYVASNQKVTLADLEQGIRSLAKDEIGKLNLTSDVEAVLSTKSFPSIADAEGAAEAKVKELLANLKLSFAGQPVEVHAGDPPAPVAEPQPATFGTPAA